MKKLVKSNVNVVRRNMKVFMLGLILGTMLGVVGTGATLSAAYADEISAPKAESLQKCINSLEDADMQILGKSMKREKIEEANKLLGGASVNNKSFLATYCTVDDEFAEIIIDYCSGIGEEE